MPAKKSPSPAKTKPVVTKTSLEPSLQGSKAPAFELPDQAGNKVALKDLVGKKNLILYFYPKDMTPGCTTEACSFRDNIEGIRRLGAQVIGISGDSSVSHQKFIDKHALNFPLLADVGNEVGKRYGVYKMKSMYGREYMGYERTTMVIDKSGIIRKVFPKVKVNGHTAEVIGALKEIG
jgi:thioredoxin-dependent peroxiredoxin